MLLLYLIIIIPQNSRTNKRTRTTILYRQVMYVAASITKLFKAKQVQTRGLILLLISQRNTTSGILSAKSILFNCVLVQSQVKSWRDIKSWLSLQCLMVWRRVMHVLLCQIHWQGTKKNNTKFFSSTSMRQNWKFISFGYSTVTTQWTACLGSTYI